MSKQGKECSKFKSLLTHYAATKVAEKDYKEFESELEHLLKR